MGAHRIAAALERTAREMLAEIAWAWTRPGRRDAVTSALYARQPTYLRGGRNFEGGLFRWEEEALALPTWPRSGRILLAGAGGGRELRVLSLRGYGVSAFEPVPAYAEGCARECASFPRSRCTQGSYADLVDAVRGGTGPLAGLVDGRPFDGVLLGWGSLAHVTDPALAGAILDAARELAPEAPLFTSFYTAETVNLPGPRLARTARGVGRLFALLGAPGRRPPGGMFLPWGGFVQTTSAEAFAEWAARHGYRVATLSTALPQPWAMLVPAVTPAGDGRGSRASSPRPA